jgi:hypothetical protein
MGTVPQKNFKIDFLTELLGRLRSRLGFGGQPSITPRGGG